MQTAVQEVFKGGYSFLLQVLSPEERKGPRTHLLGTRRADPFSVRHAVRKPPEMQDLENLT